MPSDSLLKALKFCGSAKPVVVKARCDSCRARHNWYRAKKVSRTYPEYHPKGKAGYPNAVFYAWLTDECPDTKGELLYSEFDQPQQESSFD